jgi:tetratricopeptide (TPR) repeat protein
VGSENDVKDVAACLRLAAACLDRNDGAGAIKYYHRAIEIDPRDGEAYYCLGRVHLVQEELELAITYLQKAIEANPSDGSALFDMGIARANKRDPDFVDYIVKAARLGNTEAQAFCRSVNRNW